MQPRGQLWFHLEALCQDFKTCSGLDEKAALATLIVVFNNMAAELQADLDKLAAPPGEA